MIPLKFRDKNTIEIFKPFLNQIAWGELVGGDQYKIHWDDIEIETYNLHLNEYWTTMQIHEVASSWNVDWFVIADPDDIIRFRLNDKR
jgi:hypothetical protein